MQNQLLISYVYYYNYNRYKKRCGKALTSQNTSQPSIMSMIIDGMDQSHCRVPNLGSQSSFTSPLKQVITGVKEHGIGVTIFRSIDTVSKGADLSIQCILSQIEYWKMRNGYYPEEIYLQVDGGSENANQYLLAMLELLVVKRVARVMYYTRLPTGHTHEDIDACFALIWTCFRYSSCETLQMYKDEIEKCFTESALNAKVKDIMIVPNYQSFLEKCIDKKLARLHKDIQTQHQWRFEALKPSVHFPLGCKTTFRAYSSEKVVEFVKKPKLQCISPIGQYTGLEATTLYCRWYPSAKCDPARVGIEGFYLLRNMPPTVTSLPPCEFPEHAYKSIMETLKEVRDRFDIYDDSDIRNAWDSWAAKWAPLSNDATEYVQQLKRNGLPYHIPLKNILLNANAIISDHDKWKNDMCPVTDINIDFVWPEIIAAALNSVVSEFNPHPPNPRMYSPTDVALTEAIVLFNIKSSIFYDGVLKASTNNFLQSLIKRKIGYNGEIPAISGILYS